jgi:putative membrane protein
MDSLSFTFVAYVSFALAQWLRLPHPAGDREIIAVRRSAPVLFLAALLFMLIDVVIDPVALRGDQWFLGRVYEYPSPGVYFGVPLSNFAGWAVVGFMIIAIFQWIDRALPDDPTSGRGVRPVLSGVALYYLILAFNLCMTFVIGEHLLGFVGIMLYLPVTWLAVTRLWRLSIVPGLASRGAVRT